MAVGSPDEGPQGHRHPATASASASTSANVGASAGPRLALLLLAIVAERGALAVVDRGGAEAPGLAPPPLVRRDWSSFGPFAFGADQRRDLGASSGAPSLAERRRARAAGGGPEAGEDAGDEAFVQRSAALVELGRQAETFEEVYAEGAAAPGHRGELAQHGDGEGQDQGQGQGPGQGHGRHGRGHGQARRTAKGQSNHPGHPHGQQDPRLRDAQAGQHPMPRGQSDRHGHPHGQPAGQPPMQQGEFHHPGPGHAATCEDAEDRGVHWKDKEGYACHDYEKNRYCSRSGGAGPGWDSAFDGVGNWAEGLKFAGIACCACGGSHQAWDFFMTDPDNREEWLDYQKTSAILGYSEKAAVDSSSQHLAGSRSGGQPFVDEYGYTCCDYEQQEHCYASGDDYDAYVADWTPPGARENCCACGGEGSCQWCEGGPEGSAGSTGYDGYDDTGRAANADTAGGQSEELLRCDQPMWQENSFVCEEGATSSGGLAWTDPWGSKRAKTESGGKCTVRCPSFYHSVQSKDIFCFNGTWVTSENGANPVIELACRVAVWMKALLTLFFILLFGGIVLIAYAAFSRFYMSGIEQGTRGGDEVVAGNHGFMSRAGHFAKDHTPHMPHHHHSHSAGSSSSPGKDGKGKDEETHKEKHRHKLMPHMPEAVTKHAPHMPHMPHLPGHGKKDKDKDKH